MGAGIKFLQLAAFALSQVCDTCSISRRACARRVGRHANSPPFTHHHHRNCPATPNTTAQHAGYGWFDATVRPIQVVAELTTIPGYTNWMTPETYLGLYYTALAWVLLFVGLFVWATASFIRQKWPVLWPLRVLAAMGTTSATLLYIPLFYLLMSGFTCHLPQVRARRLPGGGCHVYTPIHPPTLRHTNTRAPCRKTRSGRPWGTRATRAGTWRRRSSPRC